MIKLTPAILEKMEEEIETSHVLYAIDVLDELRGLIGDGEDFGPPQIRDDLLQLHQLLFKLIREGYAPGKKDGEVIFELIDDIDCVLYSVIEHAEKILEIISPIQALISEGDDDKAWTEDE